MASDNLENSPEILDNGNDGESLRIKIIGVGGAGNNAVDRLKLDDLQQVHLAVVNTDSQVLASSPLQDKILIGDAVTRGLSAGGEPDIGRRAAEADLERLEQLVGGVDLVFLLAGLGGGTGSGSTPVLAEAAMKAGALVLAFVTLPFTLEGARRHQQAQDAMTDLRRTCHAVIPLPNDILLQQMDKNASVLDAYALADEWISRGVRAICSMLFDTGLINVDFATLKKGFDNRGGKTLFGLGYGCGEDFENKAVEELLLCPLLHTPEFSRKADSLIVNITGGPDLSMNKVNEIMTLITEKFGSRDNTVMGAVIDENMQGSLSICVIGTTDVNGDKARPFGFFTGSRPVESTVADDTTSAVLESSHTAKGGGKEPPRHSQDVFAFSPEEVQRGYFEKSEQSLYNGEDLDVPTYLRRGIKIKI